MADQKFGVFDDIVAMTPEPLRLVTIRLRELVLSVDPEACVVVRLGDRAATFGVGPKKMSEGYCYILPYGKWVNLGFYKGADLPDPGALLEGTGAKLRHIKMRSLKDCENPKIVELVRASVAERRFALGLE